MPAQRRSNLIRQRRRVEDEGEDDPSTAQEHLDDTQSEASVPSDMDQDADADDSDLSGADAPDASLDGPAKPVRTHSGSVKASKTEKKPSSTPPAPDVGGESSFTPMKDTDAMMNGLQSPEKGAADNEALDFETLGDQAPAQPVIVRTDGHNENRKQESLQDRRRREHEDYKKKRDNDPAFVPNRGNFFMHDTVRAQGGPVNGFRPFPGRGRGRGRNGMVGPIPPTS